MRRSPAKAKSSRVTWKDVSDAASSMFRIWSGQPELRWGRAAWKVLGRRGLTEYSDEIERTKVLVRLMSLVTMYQEFCGLAWEEWHEPEYEMWATELGMSPFRIGQLVSPEFQRDTEEETERLVEQALADLVEKARAEVYEALTNGFSGDSMLFVSLWKSNGSDKDVDPYFVLNDVTFDKMGAFAWITNGMPRVR